MAEIDLVFDDADEADPSKADSAEDVVPPLPSSAVTARGDIGQLGRHRLICGDAQDVDVFARLLAILLLPFLVQWL